MATSAETLYGNLYISPLAWGTLTSTAAQTTTNTSSGLVGVIGSDGMVNYEGRLAVVRGGLGNATRWDSVQGNWGGTSAPTATFAVSVVGISGTNVGQFVPIPASLDTTGNTIVIRDSSGNIISNNITLSSQFFYDSSYTSALGAVVSGHCVTTSSSTGTNAPTLINFPLGSWTGTATGIGLTAITGRGSAAIVRNSGAATGGASLEVEFRALYNGSVTGSSAWSFPGGFNRLARYGDTAMTPTDTSQLTLQLYASTGASNPALFVNAVGQPGASHYWSGLFHLSASRN